LALELFLLLPGYLVFITFIILFNIYVNIAKKLYLSVIILNFYVLGTPMASLVDNERVRQKLLSQLEFPIRFGKPDGEFNKLVVHLIENTYMNGEIIRIDAGTKLGKL
jgi:hypothetical protein